MAYIGQAPTNAPLTSSDIQDGVIVAADLAPNSVDSSELVDGSIDTSHLSSSLTLTTPNLGTPSAITLTNATFPAGHVLQVVWAQDSTARSGTGEVLACSSTITPQFNNSKILALGMVHMQIANDDSGDSYKGGINLKTTGSGVNAQTVKFGQWNGTGYYGIKIYLEDWTDAIRMTQMYSVQNLFDPQTTNAVTCDLNGHGMDAADGTVSINEDAGSSPYGQHSALTLMEIKV